ncbi:MAG: DUF1190 domain-containing protein [Telmatospirillum sp.]|nr:DUF1190 domain-containing protein [Telmatospirillum sp.]
MRKLRPLLLASVAALALAACDDKNDIASEFIRDEAQCASQSDPSACRQALADARTAHQRTAPAFASQTACEERFGAANCQLVTDIRPTAEQLAAAAGDAVPAAAAAAAQAPQQVQQASGGWFMPLLTGYMLGRMMGGGMSAQPLYRDTNNRAYSGTRPMGRFDDRMMPPPRPVGQAASMPRGPQQAAGAPVQERRASTAPVQRGGFGMSGGGRASGG